MNPSDGSDSMDDHDYFLNKRSDRTYISKAFVGSAVDGSVRAMRIISKVLDSEESQDFVKIKGETVLRVSKGQRQEIKAFFYEDSKQIDHVVIQRFSKDTGKPIRQSFSFSPDEVKKLLDLFRTIAHLEFGNTGKLRIDDNVLDQILLGDEQKRKFLVANPNLVAEVARNNLTQSDIVALGYRKKQLAVFERLLDDETYFLETQNAWGTNAIEATWQRFFERNQWIFGYGLSYLFVSSLDDKKLEQVTTGFAVNQAGKRADAVMKTRGLISTLCFVEIKTHRTPLLSSRAYRPESWRVSDELAGSIAQTQKTVQKATRTIQTRFAIDDESGDPTGEVVFLYQPRSFVVVGSLSEFVAPSGINEQKFSSFELFRRSISSPEIITFDELYERAKFIVRLSENEGKGESENEIDQTGEEIPF